MSTTLRDTLPRRLCAALLLANPEEQRVGDVQLRASPFGTKVIRKIVQAWLVTRTWKP